MKYNKLLSKICIRIYKNKNCTAMNNQNSFWKQYLKLNNQTFLLFKEIVAQNKFWCPYLTFFYTLYLLESCYYTYGFFFNKNNTIGFFLRIFFAVGAVYFLGMLVFVTWQCSKVVFQNCQIQKTAQKLAIRFSLVYQLSIHEMMTIDAIAANYRYVKKVSFKLLNNYRVDSRMFQQLLSYIMMLFLMIFRQ